MRVNMNKTKVIFYNAGYKLRESMLAFLKVKYLNTIS